MPKRKAKSLKQKKTSKEIPTEIPKEAPVPVPDLPRCSNPTVIDDQVLLRDANFLLGLTFLLSLSLCFR